MKTQHEFDRKTSREEKILDPKRAPKDNIKVDLRKHALKT
jgi:hypothetical protein